jgi:hypothetical protein
MVPGSFVGGIDVGEEIFVQYHTVVELVIMVLASNHSRSHGKEAKASNAHDRKLYLCSYRVLNYSFVYL